LQKLQRGRPEIVSNLSVPKYLFYDVHLVFVARMRGMSGTVLKPGATLSTNKYHNFYELIANIGTLL
jgi:hypothetical protein